MNIFKRQVVTAGLLLTGLVAQATTPTVVGTTVSQDPQTLAVTVVYEIDAPAIVTVQFYTNAADGVEGALAIPDALCTNLTGDVNRLVGTAGAHTFVWRPNPDDFPGKNVKDKAFRAKVCAWSRVSPPPYMVCDLVTPSNTSYYASAEALPGGLLANDDYRTTKLVLKKVEASRETWTRGSSSESGRTTANGLEEAHLVTLTNDYYLGVFEFTQAQYVCIDPTANFFNWKGDKRPADGVSYRYLRDLYAVDGDATYCYPAGPAPTAFLGLLQARTGEALDLPSESQWEFAARAGHGDNVLGDGSQMTDANLQRLARFASNAYVQHDDGSVTTNATADVGSYAANDFGFYDMAGNVREWCLDWGQGSDYSNEITASNGRNVTALAGAVNAVGNRVPAAPVTAAGGDQRSHTYQVGDFLIGQDRSVRGGAYCDNLTKCRPRYRGDMTHYAYANGSSFKQHGFRVALTLGK